MKVVVTCGPSFAPIDEVRRLTNFSTGELGVRLSRELVQAGHAVTCLRSLTSTYADRLEGVQVLPFGTNADLATQLQDLAKGDQPDVLFHAAALSDFEVSRILDATGQVLHSRKIPSRQDNLTLELKPSPKVIHDLRTWFPQTRIIGWKYELEGSREEILARSQQQITECHTNACVLNGRAYGEGFGFYQPAQPLQHLADKAALCRFLTQWLV